METVTSRERWSSLPKLEKGIMVLTQLTGQPNKAVTGRFVAVLVGLCKNLSWGVHSPVSMHTLDVPEERNT